MIFGITMVVNNYINKEKQLSFRLQRILKVMDI